MAFHPMRRNALDVPELLDYRRTTFADGRVKISYLQRPPHGLMWQLVEIDCTPCRTCGERVPTESLSSGVCVPCQWPRDVA